jgi:gamma-glutamylcyclotransferase (GGCT)/AIG2-like uncharacterized protein YtfP
MLHFAYGSNMSRDLMGRHCPDATALGVARLPGWRFIVTRDGYASIAPAPDGVVHGVLWRLEGGNLAALDAYEDVAGGLYTRCTLPVCRDARVVHALVYLARERRKGNPRPGYSELVVAAARDWGLPAEYIRGLEAWTPARAPAARMPAAEETR